MTINTSDITSGPYTGNGVTSQFSYDFRVENKNQLIVYETTDLGVVSTLTVDTHYTVNNVGTDGGGTIDRIAGALPTNYTWYIRSNYVSTQLTDFASQSGFFPQIHESALDKLTFLIQQNEDQISRAVRVPESFSDAVDLTLPDPEADKTILWNATADGIVNGPSLATFISWANAAALSETNAAASEAAADADAIATAADRVQTGLDLVATNQDTIDTAADVVTVAADKGIVAADKAIVAADKGIVAADKAIVAADLVLTNADVVLTGLDVAATNADVVTVAGIYDQFDDRYLGSKASDPTLDNDGNALLTGALYWNTTTGDLRVYDGAVWIAIGLSTTAGAVTYDNTTSGLTAADVQAAIDEVEGRVDTTETNIALKANLASPALTGNPTSVTPATADNDTSIATTAYVKNNLASYATTASVALKADIASPALTGTPTAPTPSTADNTTKIATTAYVQSNLASVGGTAPTIQIFTASGTWTRPAGMVGCRVTVQGGGGGGYNGGGGFGAGGGGGGAAIEVMSAATAGASQTVTRGAGGSSNGTGGTSSFGALLSATGGTGGSNSGGLGGSGSGGDINIAGQRSATATVTGTPTHGGDSFLGVGGPGGSTSVAGAGYGGGGGGGYNSSGGAVGAAGIVIVEEFY